MSHPETSCGLDARKGRALDLRMLGLSWQAIADKMNEDGGSVSDETLRRWSFTPEWRAEHARRRAEIDHATQEAQVGLVALSYEAIRATLTSKTASHADKLRAADLGLTYLGPAVRTEVDINGNLSTKADADLHAIIAAALTSQGGTP